MARRARRLVELQYRANTRRAVAEIRRLTGQSARMQREMSGHLRALRSGWRAAGQAIVTVNQTLQLMSTLWRGISGPLTRVTRESLDQAEGWLRLNRSLAAHGVALSDVRDQVDSLTTAQQRWTRFGDDQTRAAMDQLARATRGLTLDYADLERGTLLLQDAHEDTRRSTESLAQAVAQFAAQGSGQLTRIMPAYRAQLDTIGELDDATARYRATLDLLEEAYGGQSRAIDSLTLDLARLDNGLGDVREALGDLITNALRSSGVIGDLATATDDLALQIADANSGAGRFVRDGLRALIGGAGFAVRAVMRIAQGVQALVDLWEVAAAKFWETAAWWARQLQSVGIDIGLVSATEEAEAALVRLRGTAGGVAAALADNERELAILREIASEAAGEERRAIEDTIAARERSSAVLREQQDALAPAIAAARAEFDALDRSVDDAVERAVGNMQRWETRIESVGDAVGRLRDGLRESFEPPDGAADTGGAGTGRRGGAGGVADLIEEAQKEWNKHWEGLQALWDAHRAELTLKEEARIEHEANLLAEHLSELRDKKEAHREHELEMVRAHEEEKRLLMEETARVQETQQQAVQQLWMTGVNQMVGGLRRLVGDADASWEQIAGSMLQSMGGAMQQISLAMIAGGTAAGPFGWPMLAFGIGAQMAAALLGRGGGRRAARQAAAVEGVRAPLDAQQPAREEHYHVHAGAVFATRDAMRRGVADLVDEAGRLGELPR